MKQVLSCCLLNQQITPVNKMSSFCSLKEQIKLQICVVFLFGAEEYLKFPEYGISNLRRIKCSIPHPYPHHGVGSLGDEGHSPPGWHLYRQKCGLKLLRFHIFLGSLHSSKNSGCLGAGATLLSLTLFRSPLQDVAPF